MTAESLSRYFNETRDLLAASSTEALDNAVDRTVETIAAALGQGRPLLIAGNGGSASDAMHITGELVGRYLKERPAYKVIALSANTAVLTAWANDYEYETVFSRQVEAYAESGGVVLGISTSGNSANIVKALERGRQLGMTTVALTGLGGGACASHADILLDVPSHVTPRIQEIHIGIYHYLCERIEVALTH